MTVYVAENMPWKMLLKVGKFGLESFDVLLVRTHIFLQGVHFFLHILQHCGRSDRWRPCTLQDCPDLPLISGVLLQALSAR